jgi:hypothetical protein
LSHAHAGILQYIIYIPAWRNVKYQHGRGTKYSGTSRGLFHFQICNFPEESFILISFRYSVVTVYSISKKKEFLSVFRSFSRIRRSENVTGTSSEAKKSLHSDWSRLAVRAGL